MKTKLRSVNDGSKTVPSKQSKSPQGRAYHKPEEPADRNNHAFPDANYVAARKAADELVTLLARPTPGNLEWDAALASAKVNLTIALDPNPEFLCPSDQHPTCLCLYDRVGQAPVNKIPLTDGELSGLMLRVAKTGAKHGEVETLIAKAVREVICDPDLLTNSNHLFGEWSDLSYELDKAKAFMESLIHQLNWWGVECGPPGVQEGSRMVIAFQNIANGINDSIRSRYDALGEAVKNRNQKLQAAA